MKKRVIYTIIILVLLLSLFLSLKALSKANAVANGDRPVKKVDIEADTWYVWKENDILCFQNAVIYKVACISTDLSNDEFAVKYFPVCKKCRLCGGEDVITAQVAPTIGNKYYCEKCDVETTAWFKVSYWGP